MHRLWLLGGACCGRSTSAAVCGSRSMTRPTRNGYSSSLWNRSRFASSSANSPFTAFCGAAWANATTSCGCWTTTSRLSLIFWKWSTTRKAVCRIGVPLREARAAAHALGVLHLDIKPSNLLVWISPDGRPHIRWADFGNSRLLEPGRLSELGITRLASTQTLGIDGPAEGTLHYIAPELFKGETATVRSDLYAMGVMLYQLVAGDLHKPMAAGWELNIADEVLRADVAATANGDPAQRMSSADELAKRLRGIQ